MRDKHILPGYFMKPIDSGVVLYFLRPDYININKNKRKFDSMKVQLDIFNYCSLNVHNIASFLV